MESLRNNILNPKARKLREGPAALNLIDIKSLDDFKRDFQYLINKFRSKDKEFSLEDISAEIKQIRKRSKD